MNVSIAKMTILTVFGAIGSFIANLFGGWGEDMITLLIFMGTDFLLGLLIAAFCINELISIIENLGIMGVPLPTVLTGAIELLQNKTDTKGSKK